MLSPALSPLVPRRAREAHGGSAQMRPGQAGRIFQRYMGLAWNQAASQLLNLCYETLLRLKPLPLDHV